MCYYIICAPLVFYFWKYRSYYLQSAEDFMNGVSRSKQHSSHDEVSQPDNTKTYVKGLDNVKKKQAVEESKRI